MGAPDYDVLVVGAGFGGLNALHTLRSAGLSVLVLEAGDGVGGTWYWNRYPGARVDIESMEYSYGFDDGIQQEWSWPMRWSEQPDVLRYLEWVADRLDLRRDIRFGVRVTSGAFDETAAAWTLSTDDGASYSARFCVMAVGFLSAPYLPDIPGLADFEGTVLHTAAWPRDGVDLGDKRVGVIGVGASGVQLVPRIAPETGHLTVFQRTPNWCFPIRNEPIDGDYERYVKDNYAEVRRREHEEGRGKILVDKRMQGPETERGALEVSPEERDAAFEWRWQIGAVHLITSWNDLMTNLESNHTLRDFMERKIRERVHDPEVAGKLIPTHPVWSRRPPGESGYYDAFNRDNVTLVATLDDPIVECDGRGLRLAGGDEYPLDVIICATGFDAGAGALLRAGLVGRDGEALADRWALGVRTHLGMMTAGFPNLFFVNGVQSPSAFFTPPLLADFQSRHIVELIAALDAEGARTLEPTEDAQSAWVEHLNETINATLIPMGDGWWMGGNIPGKERQVVAYVGAFPEYRRRCRDAAQEFREYHLDAGVRA